MLQKIASNWMLLGLTLVSTFSMLPINLYYLGAKGYGTWLIVLALTSYLWLLQLGVPTAVMRNLSFARANDDQSGMQRIVTTHLGSAALVGTVALMFAPLLLIFLELGLAKSPEGLAEARTALLLTTLASACVVASDLPNAMLSAYQEFIRVNITKTVLLAFKFVLNVVLIMHYPSIVTLAWVNLIGAVLDLVALFVILAFVHKGPLIARSSFRWSEIGQSIQTGIYVFLLTAGTQLMLQTSTLIVGKLLGPEHTVQYTIPMGIVIQVLLVVSSMSFVVMTAATELDAAGRREELIAMLYRWTKVAVGLSCFAASGLILLGPDLLRVWLGTTMTSSGAGAVLQIAMATMILYIPARVTALSVMMGIGQMKKPILAFFFTGLASPVLALVLIGPLDVAGVAIANGVTNFVAAIIVMSLTARALGLDTRTFLSETALRPFIGLLLVLAAGKALKLAAVGPGQLGVLGIGLVGAAITMLFAVVWYVFVLHNDRHVPRLSLDGLRRRLRGSSITAERPGEAPTSR